jgi:hypothetical protein
MERCWFIVKNMHIFSDLSILENISHVWINHKYLGAIYDEKIMEELNKCVSIYEKIE